MEKIVPPIVTLLAAGSNLTAKQMQAIAGQVMPLHHANMESILFIYAGECILRINKEEVMLETGKAVVIPKLVKHQIKAVTDFKGIHFMPKDIEFEFFNQI